MELEVSQFVKEPFPLLTTSDREEALSFAQQFDEQGVDTHITIDGEVYVVVIYLPPDMPMATIEGGNLSGIVNMPPRWRELVVDLDDQAPDPVRVHIERGFDFELDIGQVEANDL